MGPHHYIYFYIGHRGLKWSLPAPIEILQFSKICPVLTQVKKWGLVMQKRGGSGGPKRGFWGSKKGGFGGSKRGPKRVKNDENGKK